MLGINKFKANNLKNVVDRCIILTQPINCDINSPTYDADRKKYLEQLCLLACNKDYKYLSEILPNNHRNQYSHYINFILDSIYTYSYELVLSWGIFKDFNDIDYFIINHSLFGNENYYGLENLLGILAFELYIQDIARETYRPIICKRETYYNIAYKSIEDWVKKIHPWILRNYTHLHHDVLTRYMTTRLSIYNSSVPILTYLFDYLKLNQMVADTNIRFKMNEKMYLEYALEEYLFQSRVKHGYNKF